MDRMAQDPHRQRCGHRRAAEADRSSPRPRRKREPVETLRSAPLRVPDTPRPESDSALALLPAAGAVVGHALPEEACLRTLDLPRCRHATRSGPQESRQGSALSRRRHVECAAASQSFATAPSLAPRLCFRPSASATAARRAGSAHLFAGDERPDSSLASLHAGSVPGRTASVPEVAAADSGRHTGPDGPRRYLPPR